MDNKKEASQAIESKKHGTNDDNQTEKNSSSSKTDYFKIRVDCEDEFDAVRSYN